MKADRLSRIFAVIRLIASSPQTMSVSEVSRALKMPISSTHDLLRTLVELRQIDSVDGQYGIGPEAIALSAQVLDGVSVHVAARRHLIALTERTGEAVYLAVPSGQQLIYVDRYLGARRVSIHIRLGEPLYLHSTSAGKLFAALDPGFRRKLFQVRRPRLTGQTIVDDDKLSAELAGIARARLSITRGESFLGILGLAVPVWGSDGTLVAAIHVSTSEASVDDKRMAAVVSAMREVATGLMTDIGGLAPSEPVGVAPPGI
ncbi:IclR family transcriptional regulator [Antricoccus suffuscus]|uniref:IclR family transcriptional regulator n=1 Tax=Antricoccus suffuscus TaxID=1629062 RepID=A0A2T1A145_9ACTN|nr:IclR family transcriptional regulator [Antricoccus suffuscus]PRZ42330.1 IclR family transcriptional regulator [Antricoccus suffuscus]